ncbi:stage V sporulation T C-terminal domain-containing protein [Agathobaculum sp.]|uniref:stage V sporulation T C-terminal domain-containing protein n=1 Tax=Agathobaculum sp. TaxID=2048138 RepID=UPI000E550F05|nr:stage V sporulation protein T [Butyricicoccus sp. AM42-5AC]
MTDTFNIAGYCRISVDDEQDQKNISIENQKAIIDDYVKTHFSGSTLTFFEDRDRSGYTFEQRESYQEMRRGLMSHRYDILIIKDFSRFSRRNSRGLVELEDLRDAGVRIISIGDGIDFPNDDDWLKIQFQFLINEMPVTDTSRKVRNVIKRRQADGEWLCAAPYGYIINSRKQFEVVPTEAETIRQIFHLYNNEGWGYKKIANHLTEQGIPTPRMSECMRKEAEGKQVTRKAKAAWAIVTVQGILDNDFYIGTLRQGKYTRAKINGKDVRRDEGEQIVIENHHQAIIDYRTFATTRALREKRTRSNYRGIKKYDNAYSGFLVCGDCGAPMFSMSRPDLAPAYTCGTYHRRGRAGCTSHHIRVDKLDELMRLYIRRVMNGSAAMIEQLNADLAQEDNQVVETEQSADNLAELLDELTEELKVTKRQRIREIMKHPENEASIEELYEEMETELQGKIDGLKHQIDLLSDRRNTIIEANRTAKTALEVFDDLLHKPKMERNDLELMIQKIDVFEDHLEVHLQADIDELLHCTAEENVVNFNSGIESAEKCRIVQCSRNQKDKTFDVSVISSGDPLEIYTDRDGEVIFKKYSPMGEMSAMAAELADALARTAGMSCAISDRDAVIAAAGGAKKDVLEKSVSAELEQLMEQRIIYARGESSLPDIPLSGRDGYRLVTAVPVITDGDVSGCVAFISEKEDTASSEVLLGLCQSAAQFLSRRIAV